MSTNGTAFASPAAAPTPAAARVADGAPQAAQGFLDGDPPHWVARGLSGLLIVMFVAAAVAVVAVQVPETVTCHLLVVPGLGTDPVRVPHDGFVTTVRVRETEAVREGDVLFAIRVDTVGDRAGELTSVTVQLEGARESLANAARRYERQRLADADEEQRLVLHGDALACRAEGMAGVQAIKRRENATALEMVREQVGSLTREEEFRRKARAYAVEEIERGSRLNRSNMISIHEYSTLKLEAEKAGFELERVARELSTARFKALQLKAEQEGQEAEWSLKMEQLEADRKENTSSLAKLRHQAGVAESEYEEQRRALHEQMAKSSARIAALTGQLGQSTADQVLVKAPYAGIVLRLRVRSSGSFVRSGDVLCELAGTKGNVVAELTVPENGVGRVVAGQEVKLLYDAFPYERYGARYGRVRWVSPASVAKADGPVATTNADGPAAATKLDGPAFRALVDLDETTILVKGRPRPLLPGMGGRGRVVVGRRTLVSYAFEPLRQFREDMAAPPGRGVAR